MGKKSKTKSASATASAAAETASAAAAPPSTGPVPMRLVDPPALLPWAPPAKTHSGPSSTLAHEFTMAMPLSDKMALLKDPGNIKRVGLHQQLLYSLFHAVEHFAGGSSIDRLCLQAPDNSERVLFDILSGPFECPRGTIPNAREAPKTDNVRYASKELREKMKATAAKANEAEPHIPAPLLVVRYTHVRRSESKDQERRRVDAIQRTGESYGCVLAESAAEIGLFANLLQNNALYVDLEWLQRLEKQGPRDSRISVLVPPAVAVAKPPRAPARCCAQCNSVPPPPAKLMGCSRCKSAYYCDRACQKAHWRKAHKKVCGKSADELRSNGAGDARASVVVPLEEAGGMAGMTMLMSFQPGGGDYSRRAGTVQKNVHGDAEFIVKVQVPMMAGGGPCMLYDQSRSVTAAVTIDRIPGGPELLARIHRDGPAGGRKGYVMARREGDGHIRLYSDALVRPPRW